MDQAVSRDTNDDRRMINRVGWNLVVSVFVTTEGRNLLRVARTLKLAQLSGTDGTAWIRASTRRPAWTRGDVTITKTPVARIPIGAIVFVAVVWAISVGAVIVDRLS